MRCNAASKNADRCAGVGYRVSTSLTSIVRTLFGSKPVSPCLRASRLWTITPAPINSTSDSATSHTISKRRVPTPIAPSPRPPSLSASLRSDRPARTAGSVPASMPVSIDTASANSSTRASIEISSALGTWLASSVEADVSVAVREQKPERAAGGREQQRFDQQLLKHASASRAKRRANRDLLASAQGAGEEQVADVGAGDEQDQPDGAEQHDQHRAAVADDLLLHRDDHRSPACRPISGTRVRAAPRSRPFRLAPGRVRRLASGGRHHADCDSHGRRAARR